mgnify:CR=1 FL=1
MEDIQTYKEFVRDRQNKIIEYENSVLEKLVAQLKSEGIEAKRMCRNYRGKSRYHEYDFVVLRKDSEQIQSVYDVKTYNIIKRNPKFVFDRLLKYKEFEGFDDAFIVCLNEQNKLLIFNSSNNNKNESKSINKVYKANDYIEFYKIIKNNCIIDGPIDSRFFFRGHTHIVKECKCGIYRNSKLIENERKLFYEAIRKSPKEFSSEKMSTFDALVKMQHYELPTRLLDITENPLVALYFACSGEFDKDGEVLVYSVPEDQIKYYDSDTVCILANLAKRPSSFDFSREKSYLVYDIQQEKQNFHEELLFEKAINDVVCVLPRLNNERIVKQQGAFFIFGISGKNKQSSEMPDPPTKITIKANGKINILKELDLLGINESSLFPETDKIMKCIKKIYE